MEPTRSTSGRDDLGERVGRGLGRGLGVAFSAFAVVVFLALWLYVAAAAFTDGDLLSDTWAWLTGLDLIATVVVWLAILPVAVFVWAWQAALSPLFMGLVIIGLVAWTAVAFYEPLKRLYRRRLVHLN